MTKKSSQFSVRSSQSYKATENWELRTDVRRTPFTLSLSFLDEASIPEELIAVCAKARRVAAQRRTASGL